ncbi:MAG: hypothetical protein M3M85_01365 [bacterium]|nr:hypothetical protein [bacterium]
MNSLTLKIIWVDPEDNMIEVETNISCDGFIVYGKDYTTLEDLKDFAMELPKILEKRKVIFTSNDSLEFVFEVIDPQGHINANLLVKKSPDRNDHDHSANISAITEPALLDRFSKEILQMSNMVGQSANLELLN